MCKPHKFTGEEKAKYEDPPDAPRKPQRKKNRRKWCRGRVGVAHKPRWVPDPGYLSFDLMHKREPINEHQIYECETCGKHLGWRTIHLACGQVHDKWGFDYYFMNRKTGKYERKPYPCEEKAA
jgi:hypothetical protein